MRQIEKDQKDFKGSVTSKTLAGRSATFRVQGLVFCCPHFTDLNCCMIPLNLKKQFFEPSRERYTLGSFFDFCFF